MDGVGGIGVEFESGVGAGVEGVDVVSFGVFVVAGFCGSGGGGNGSAV